MKTILNATEQLAHMSTDDLFVLHKELWDQAEAFKPNPIGQFYEDLAVYVTSIILPRFNNDVDAMHRAADKIQYG